MAEQTLPAVRVPPAPELLIVESVEKYRATFDALRAMGFIVLAPPALERIPPDHHFSFHVVFVDIDPAHGEVWVLPQARDRLQLGKAVFEKLMTARGGTWVWRACGRTDDGRNPRRLGYQSVLRYKGYDGLWHEQPAVKQMDLDAQEDELRESARRSLSYEKSPPKDPEAWIEAKTYKEMIQLRKHAVARLETGTRNRCVAACLAMQRSYLPAELTKGFIVGRLDYRPDTSRPEDRKLLMAYHLGAIEELYGPPAQGALSEVRHPMLDTGDEPEEPLALAEVSQPALPPAAEPPPPAGQPTPPPQPELDQDEVAFGEAREARDAAAEVRILERLAVRKGYKMDALKRPLPQFSEQERAGFCRKLLGMPDQAQAALPWE